jgi:Family of unknown function (DUF6510)
MTMDAEDMDTDDMHMDGNASAGMLQQIFLADFTMLEHQCQACGDRNRGGAHRSYHGAGIVLRCPSCGEVGLKVSPLPGRYVFEMRGVWSMPVES